jgi:adenylyltransferase/sulfurtransferase
VLGVLPGIIGLIQTTEALKLIVGAGETLVGRLIHFDALKMKFREFKLRRDPECPICGEHPTIFAPIDYEQFCAAQTAGDAFESDGAVPSVSVQDLKQKMDARELLTLVDVREPWEYEIAQIAGARLIPLGELEERLTDLPHEGIIVVQCHSGVRSEQGARLLKQAGFENVYNLEGGIEAWSREIDPTVPRY